MFNHPLKKSPFWFGVILFLACHSVFAAKKKRSLCEQVFRVVSRAHDEVSLGSAGWITGVVDFSSEPVWVIHSTLGPIRLIKVENDPKQGFRLTYLRPADGIFWSAQSTK